MVILYHAYTYLSLYMWLWPWKMNIYIKINHGTMTPRVANWLPKFVGINLFSLGVSNGHEV